MTLGDNVKINLIVFSLLMTSNLYAQSRPYAPGIIQVPAANAAQQRRASGTRASSGAATAAVATSTGAANVTATNEVISPDDPMAGHKTLRAQYKQQIAILQSQIDALDKLISAVVPVSTPPVSTSVAVTNVATNSAMVNGARAKFSAGEIEGAIPVERVVTGSSTILTCPTGYMYHNSTGNRAGSEVCVPLPTSASSSTVTPGNVPVPATKSARGLMDECPEGYLPTSSPNDGYRTIMCTPRITEIAPGKFSCLFGEEWPEADANGKMNCVGSQNKDNSVRVCLGDTAETQGCSPGYFYDKKTKKYYPTYAEATAAGQATTRSTAAAKPSNEQIKTYLMAYKEDITKPENVARIKKDAADNGVSASELDSIMGWAAGTAQKAFNDVP